MRDSASVALQLPPQLNAEASAQTSAFCPNPPARLTFINSSLSKHKLSGPRGRFIAPDRSSHVPATRLLLGMGDGQARHFRPTTKSSGSGLTFSSAQGRPLEARKKRSLRLKYLEVQGSDAKAALPCGECELRPAVANLGSFASVHAGAWEREETLDDRVESLHVYPLGALL